MKCNLKNKCKYVQNFGTCIAEEGRICECFERHPTNADRIRSMTDEELNDLFHDIYNAGAEDAVAYEWGHRTNRFEWTMEWLQQPEEGE